MFKHPITTIIVIINRFTKIIWLKATTTNISSEEITKIYRNEIWKLYGILRKILSDREPQFVSRFIEELIKVLGTKRILLIVLLRLREVDLVSLHFISHFNFNFWFIFYFSIFRT